MQVKVSPELIALLSANETVEQHEVLVKLWREMRQEVEHQKKRAFEKQREVTVPKRARFSFD